MAASAAAGKASDCSCAPASSAVAAASSADPYKLPLLWGLLILSWLRLSSLGCTLRGCQLQQQRGMV